MLLSIRSGQREIIVPFLVTFVLGHLFWKEDLKELGAFLEGSTVGAGSCSNQVHRKANG